MVGRRDLLCLGLCHETTRVGTRDAGAVRVSEAVLAPADYSGGSSRSPLSVRGFGLCVRPVPGVSGEPDSMRRPHHRHFADINGLLRIVGLSIPLNIIGKVCAAAGLPTLIAWLLLARRTDRTFRAVWLFTLTAVYLMLFNPMNEANSYVTLAPAMAFWTVEFLVHSPGTRRDGVIFVLLIASLAFLDNALRPFVGNGFAKSWYPLVTVVWLWLTFACCRRYASDYFNPVSAGKDEA